MSTNEQNIRKGVFEYKRTTGFEFDVNLLLHIYAMHHSRSIHSKGTIEFVRDGKQECMISLHAKSGIGSLTFGYTLDEWLQLFCIVWTPTMYSSYKHSHYDMNYKAVINDIMGEDLSDILEL